MDIVAVSMHHFDVSTIIMENGLTLDTATDSSND